MSGNQNVPSGSYEHQDSSFAAKSKNVNYFDEDIDVPTFLRNLNKKVAMIR